MGTNPDKPSQPLGNLVDTDEIGHKGENSPHKQLDPFKWKPGQSGNPAGKPKGAKHKLSEDLVKALADDFKENGVTAIATVRAEDPGKYLDIIAKIIPKDVDLNVNASDAFVRLWETVAAGTFNAMAEDVSRAEKAEGRPN